MIPLDEWERGSAYQVNQVRGIVAYLEHNQVVLPNGGHLTPSRWQQLGIDFGMSGKCMKPFSIP